MMLLSNRCICDNGTPDWCPEHGDLVWSCASCKESGPRVRRFQCCGSPDIWPTPAVPAEEPAP